MKAGLRYCSLYVIVLSPPPSSRTRLLLLNSFNLAEDSITMDNVFVMIEKLNTTYPEQFAELADTLEKCNLESELDTVCSSSLNLFYSDIHLKH